MVAIRQHPGNKMIWSAAQAAAQSLGVTGGACAAAAWANALCDAIVGAGGPDKCNVRLTAEELAVAMRRTL